MVFIVTPHKIVSDASDLFDLNPRIIPRLLWGDHPSYAFSIIFV